MYDVLHTPLVNLTGSNACPTVTATPEVVKAAFTKESESSPRTASVYIDPILNLQDQKNLRRPDVQGVGTGAGALSRRE